MISRSVITLLVRTEMVRRIFFFLLVIFLPVAEIFSFSTGITHHFRIEENYDLYQENGKTGLKNSAGEVIIPAEYDALGWSNGNFSVVNNVIGFQLDGLWGLISLTNQKITDAIYLDLTPAGSLIVARKQLPNTLRIVSGCMDASGKEIIPFQYDGITISSFRAVVFLKSGIKYKHGLIDLENRILIPLQYRNIYPLGSLRYAVENFDRKIAIFSEEGKQINDFLIDSISSFKKNYAVFYQNQRQGLMDREGKIVKEATYRDIKINDDGTTYARQANAWFFLSGDNKLINQYYADSIAVIQKDRFHMRFAERVQLTDKSFKPLGNDSYTRLSAFDHNKAVFSNGNKAGVVDVNASVVIPPVYNNLTLDGDFILANQTIDNKDKWLLLDSLGKNISTKAYDYIGKYNGKFFPVKNKNFWGAMDTSGKEIIACVHDSLGNTSGNHVVVKFKGGHGIITLDEDLIVIPQANPIQLLSDTHYLELAPRTTFLKSMDGNIIYFTDNPIEIKTSYLLEYAANGAIWKIDMNGRLTNYKGIPAEAIEKVLQESEGLRAMKKDGRYGFIDDRGRLRIANRYENVKSFSDGLAAVMIRGKWGFINHEDNIAIQPVYDEVQPFREGFALVKQKDNYGLVDVNAKLILPVRYESIKVLPSRLLLFQQNGLLGLSDATGKVVVNPKYTQLQDLNNGYFIVERNGKYGVLTHQGVSTIPEIYDSVAFDAYHNQFMALKKAGWEELSVVR